MNTNHASNGLEDPTTLGHRKPMLPSDQVLPKNSSGMARAAPQQTMVARQNTLHKQNAKYIIETDETQNEDGMSYGEAHRSREIEVRQIIN